jgi:hypothetical protein
MMGSKRHLSRRTFLRGAGTVAIGLPFLEEMVRGRVAAAGGDPPPPDRLITLFFGLGLDPDWQKDFSGALEPLEPFASKMARCSVNVRQGSAGGAHCNTSAVIFVGEEQESVNVAGGPSIDQYLRREIDPAAAVLVSGLWWRRGACDAQALRVFNPDGSPRTPIKRPSEVFDRVFGSVEPPPMDPDPGMSDPEAEAARRAARIRRSVLDTVVEQYRHYRGDRSPLGAASKLKIEQHLTSIREIETQLAPADEIIDDGSVDDGGPGGGGGGDVDTCELPSRPTDPDIADYDRFTYGTGSRAPEIAYTDVERVFHLHADLYALALRCDLVRYGNLMFESAGGHTNLSGTYRALGRSTSFPGDSQHDSYFHRNQKGDAELYQHFALSNLAYFLDLLDDPAHAESNGKTVLENSTVVIGTEYGWNHSKEHVFHAVVGGGGRFKAGDFTSREMNAIDLYNAILEGYGVADPGIGTASRVESEGDGSVILA